MILKRVKELKIEKLNIDFHLFHLKSQNTKQLFGIIFTSFPQNNFLLISLVISVEPLCQTLDSFLVLMQVFLQVFLRLFLQ